MVLAIIALQRTAGLAGLIFPGKPDNCTHVLHSIAMLGKDKK
jgi:hypothetical protein